jgi:hypothetical protein
MYTVVLHKRSNHRNFGVFIGKDVPKGFYVVTVEPNSPAADANIQPGDHLIAINGQLVSSIPENSIEMIARILSQAESLTLSLQSSDILKLAGIFSMNHNHEYTSSDTKDLEKYDDFYLFEIISSLFSYLKLILHNNIKIIPVLSSNQNEYILTYSTNTFHHRKRKRKRHLKNSETQTSLTYDQVSSPRRIIPSMGTSHAILRNTQSNPKDPSEIKSTPSINHSGWSSYTPPQQSLPTSSSSKLTEENLRSISEIVSNSSSSIDDDDDGVHEVHLHRSPNYPDYGFHLQYNQVYYIVNQIELNSPAERSGLRVGDVIRRVNNHSTDRMPHHILVEHIIRSKEVIFLVQPLDKFLRDNPEVLVSSKETIATTKKKKIEWKNRNIFSKALSKLKSL